MSATHFFLTHTAPELLGHKGLSWAHTGTIRVPGTRGGTPSSPTKHSVPRRLGPGLAARVSIAQQHARPQTMVLAFFREVSSHLLHHLNLSLESARLPSLQPSHPCSGPQCSSENFPVCMAAAQRFLPATGSCPPDTGDVCAKSSPHCVPLPRACCPPPSAPSISLTFHQQLPCRWCRSWQSGLALGPRLSWLSPLDWLCSTLPNQAQSPKMPT